MAVSSEQKRRDKIKKTFLGERPDLIEDILTLFVDYRISQERLRFFVAHKNTGKFAH